MLDAWLFSAINNLTGHSSVADGMMVFIAHYLIFVLAVVFIILLFRPLRNRVERRRIIIVASGAAITGYVLKSLITLTLPRPRPFVVEPVHQLLSQPIGEYFQSFPSGHAAALFAAAGVIFYFNRKWGIRAMLLALLVGFARVYVGIHWPSDIFGGAALGLFVAIIFIHLYQHYKKPIDAIISHIFFDLKREL